MGVIIIIMRNRNTVKLQLNTLGFSAIPSLTLYFHGSPICPPICVYLKSGLPRRHIAFNALLYTVFFTFFVEKSEKNGEKGEKYQLKDNRLEKFRVNSLFFGYTYMGVYSFFIKKKKGEKAVKHPVYSNKRQ